MVVPVPVPVLVLLQTRYMMPMRRNIECFLHGMAEWPNWNSAASCGYLEMTCQMHCLFSVQRAGTADGQELGWYQSTWPAVCLSLAGRWCAVERRPLDSGLIEELVVVVAVAIIVATTTMRMGIATGTCGEKWIAAV